MKTIKKVIAICILLCAFILVFSCGSSDSSTKPNEVSEKRDSVYTGAELFRLNCAGCHGLNREGNPPNFPPLIYVKEKMSKDQIHSQVLHGKGLMHSLAHLSDSEVNAIIAYLFNEAEQQKVSENYSSEILGKNIVMSNCVTCHRLSEKDSLPADAKKLCPLVEPSALQTGAKKLNKEQFLLILKTGPCYMPSFDYLNKNDKEAIWSYLRTI